jgi:PAS domain S-box-containing protein
LLASEAAISLENARLYHDLQERESRMRRLVDANIIGIVLWHRDGRILEANDAFLRMVGHERQDVVTGRVRWGDLSPPDWVHEDMRAMESVRILGAVQAFEREVLRKDGLRVPVLMGAASFEGTADEGVGYFLDLSESKRAEQIARDSERRNHELQMRLADANRIASIGQLAAAIAHEINQPLAGIITNASTGTRMLSVDPVDVRAVGETIRRTLRDAERASEVIRRLRSLFTGHALAAERVDLNEIAESVAAMLALDFRRDGIDLELQLERGLPCVLGDQVQLQQVILNMLRNAAQATQGVDDRIRRVVLKTRTEVEGRVQLSVTDTGGGLDPASKGKLFDAFYTTKPDGMGIGLSVSRSIVERHDGRLWAEANAGPGATFAFSLPAVS